MRLAGFVAVLYLAGSLHGAPREMSFRRPHKEFSVPAGTFRIHEGVFQTRGVFNSPSRTFTPTKGYKPESGSFRNSSGSFRPQSGQFKPAPGTFRVKPNTFYIGRGFLSRR
jgi:hypothetical protein